jgi:hypothetical protein
MLPEKANRYWADNVACSLEPGFSNAARPKSIAGHSGMDGRIDCK